MAWNLLSYYRVRFIMSAENAHELEAEAATRKTDLGFLPTL